MSFARKAAGQTSGMFVKDSFNVAGSGQSIKGMRRVGERRRDEPGKKNKRLRDIFCIKRRI